MFEPIKIVDEELTNQPRSLEGLTGYIAVKLLIRIHGIPIGWIQIPVINGQVSAEVIRRSILDRFNWQITQHFLQNALAQESITRIEHVEDLFRYPPSELKSPLPLITVAVCTRDRTQGLQECLNSLIRLDYPKLEFLVIDNAPSNEDTARLVRGSYPSISYIREERPGLDWARNRAILESKGEIIAYTDDDVVVDYKWATALAEIFTESPEAMAVTGLVVPYELENRAQILFEMGGGFDRGFQRKWVYPINYKGKVRVTYGTGQFGTGANMAYRRCLFDQIGGFDPALDVGTLTNGGGDLEMFFRVLKEGYTLIYEPRAIVRHRHRRNYVDLKIQFTNHGIGLYSYLVRSALYYPKERWSIAHFGQWWFRWWSVRRLVKSFLYTSLFPRELIWSELKGSIIGLGRYFQARRIASKISSSNCLEKELRWQPQGPVKDNSYIIPKSTAIRNVDLSRPLTAIDDVKDYEFVNIYVYSKEKLHGCLTINNNGNPVSKPLLRQVLIENFGLSLFDNDLGLNRDFQWAEVQMALKRHFMPNGQETKPVLPENISIAVIVATFDRPEDLRLCLNSLVKQKTNRKVEIIVVDNHPESGLTPPVVSEFPGVKLVTEKRQGLSYARNAGISNSSAEIIVTTDDDVIAPANWVENLIQPFVRSDVMAVTGCVLPSDLKTLPQRLFEQYGGLGRGYKRWEAGPSWFDSFKKDAVPTWNLGGAANSAFRASIFKDPKIGLFEEMLGAGSPTGCSEDTFLFYKILNGGHEIIYEPKVFVWHNHRASMQALKKQIYNYSKGHVAYHLLTLIRFKDLRPIFRLFYHLPRWHIKQLYRYTKAFIKGDRDRYPLILIFCEIMGNLAGPWSLWRSWRRVKHEMYCSKFQSK